MTKTHTENGYFEKAVRGITAFGIIFSLTFTGWEIRNAAMTQEAALLYEIQRDGRDILTRVSKIQHYLQCVHRTNDCNEQEINEARTGIRFVLQFYTSVHNQYRMDALDKKHWLEFKKEICNYANLPEVKNFWCDYQSSYNEYFQGVITSCLIG